MLLPAAARGVLRPTLAEWRGTTALLPPGDREARLRGKSHSPYACLPDNLTACLQSHLDIWTLHSAPCALA